MAKKTKNPETKQTPEQFIDELGLTKIELQNHIDGLEISKSTGYWNEDDERTLNLMNRLIGILDRIEVVSASDEADLAETPSDPRSEKE